MSSLGNHRTSVSALMGVAIHDAEGSLLGRVREFAVSPQVDASRVQGLVVGGSMTEGGKRPHLVTIASLKRDASGRLALLDGEQPAVMDGTDDYLLLERDLLDQQIIDVHGHKVVRVNDVDLVWETASNEDAARCDLVLRIAEVEVGLRGAARRLLKGLPESAVDRIACRLKSMVIPWDFVDLIDRDPARRVRLKIEQDRLAKMHPADLAAILEELAPAESQALFSSLDEEVAAEALEELEPKTQQAMIEALDSERVAGIIEEMDPGAAADLLSELPEERSDAILEEMDEEERHDLEELLEYSPDSAAGLMTTDYVAVSNQSTVEEAITALEQFDGDIMSVTDVFVIDGEGHLEGAIPMARLILSKAETKVAELHDQHKVCTGMKANGNKVAELFDKYNLRSLPVMDEENKLAGVIHAEHVIAWLRTDG